MKAHLIICAHKLFFFVIVIILLQRANLVRVDIYYKSLNLKYIYQEPRYQVNSIYNTIPMGKGVTPFCGLYRTHRPNGVSFHARSKNCHFSI